MLTRVKNTFLIYCTVGSTPTVTFSHSDFYKVNEIVFKPFLFDFSKVEQVLCSSLSLFDFTKLTLVKSKEFCVQAFAVLLLKSNRFCVQAFTCSTLVKSNEFCVQAFAVLFDFSKVERVLCSKPFLFDFSKVKQVLCSSLSCLTFVKVNTYFCFRGNLHVRLYSSCSRLAFEIF